jgi:hypothetical protein
VTGELLAGWGMSRWYALDHGLWAGLPGAGVDLPEPLAYGLAAAGLLAMERAESARLDPAGSQCSPRR